MNSGREQDRGDVKLYMPGIPWFCFNAFYSLTFQWSALLIQTRSFAQITALSLTSLYLGNTQTLPHGAPKGDRGTKSPRICELFLLDKQKNETR